MRANTLIKLLHLGQLQPVCETVNHRRLGQCVFNRKEKPGKGAYAGRSQTRWLNVSECNTSMTASSSTRSYTTSPNNSVRKWAETSAPNCLRHQARRVWTQGFNKDSQPRVWLIFNNWIHVHQWSWRRNVKYGDFWHQQVIFILFISVDVVVSLAKRESGIKTTQTLHIAPAC